MPRKNRPRRSARHDGSSPEDLTRALSGWRRTERKRGRTWNVQPVPAASALKTYRCPGCPVDIEPGTAHLVVWRADGVLGDTADLAERRHWHTRCWRATP